MCSLSLNRMSIFYYVISGSLKDPDGPSFEKPRRQVLHGLSWDFNLNAMSLARALSGTSSALDYLSSDDHK